MRATIMVPCSLLKAVMTPPMDVAQSHSSPNPKDMHWAVSEITQWLGNWN